VESKIKRDAVTLVNNPGYCSDNRNGRVSFPGIFTEVFSHWRLVGRPRAGFALNSILTIKCIGVLAWTLLINVSFSIASPVNAFVTVASINLCADQLVLLLADDEQVLTLSNLSHRPAGSYYYKEARKYPVNKGHSEPILKLNPDVVIVGQFSNVHTVNLLREVGLRVETLPIANDLETLFSNIESVASWIGKEQAADALIAKLRSRVAQVQETEMPGPVAAVFDPNGYTSGKNSLRGQLMELAGWQNAASIAGIEQYGKLSLEQIIRLAPDALIESPYSPGTYSRAQRMSRHPALLESGLKPHIIDIPSRMTVCAGPWTIDVLEKLQAERIKLREKP